MLVIETKNGSQVSVQESLAFLGVKINIIRTMIGICADFENRGPVTITDCSDHFTIIVVLNK